MSIPPPEAQGAAEHPGPLGHNPAATRPVVVLVGVPGAGKSTVGRALAKSLGVELRDTDADIEELERRTIADIFVSSGEAEFRRLEVAAVAAALAEHRGVLALGGGAVTSAETRALLAGQAVVWLRVGLAAASRRAGLSGARPMLLGNVRAQLKTLMDARAALYDAVATLTIDTDDLSVPASVTAIEAGLGLHRHGSDDRSGRGPGPADAGVALGEEHGRA